MHGAVFHVDLSSVGVSDWTESCRVSSEEPFSVVHRSFVQGRIHMIDVGTHFGLCFLLLLGVFQFLLAHEILEELENLRVFNSPYSNTGIIKYFSL